MARRVLLVDVDPMLRERIAGALPDAELTSVDAIDDQSELSADAVVCDWERTGQACLAGVRTRDLRIPVIALLESRDEADVVAAMRGGASDVFVTDRLSRLADIVERDVGVVSAAPPSTLMQLSELRFRSLWNSDIILITVVAADG
jgi:DNA-binding NarL/FixJ family response regulator